LASSLTFVVFMELVPVSIFKR